MSPDSDRPVFIADHVSWTVPDLDAVAAFYVDVFGAEELWRMGPLGAADLPAGDNGRDWMENHVGVAGAKLTLAMFKLTQNLNFQLVQYDEPSDRGTIMPRNCDRGGHHLGLKVDNVDAAARYLAKHGCTILDVIEIHDGPLAGHKNLYLLDPFGHQLELVD